MEPERFSDQNLQEDILLCVHNTKQLPRWVKRDKLPGPLPATICRGTLETLGREKYWVCEKSDGERRFLFIKPDGNAYFVDRKFNFQKVIDGEKYSEHFASNGDTLLDGELVEQKSKEKRLVYMVFDCIAMDGKYCGELPLSQRLGKLAEFHISKVSKQLPIQAKRFYLRKDIKCVFGKIQKSKNGTVLYVDQKRNICNKNDGVIFTPENDNYLCKGNSGGILKWKWAGMNTVDFLTKPNNQDQSYILYAGGPYDSIKIAKASISQTNQEEKNILKHELSENGLAIVECAYDPNKQIWKIKNVRPDKMKPNYITTVFSTMQCIVDNISQKDLQRHCEMKYYPKEKTRFKPEPREFRENRGGSKRYRPNEVSMNQNVDAGFG